jgi:predicted nucleic acid-binding protein
LIKALGAGPVAVDTAVFIYFIEEHPKYLPLIGPLFNQVDAGTRELVTSALTLLEVLVVPYRAGDLALAERYEAILSRSRGLRMIELDRAQLRTAAQIRAVHGVRTPDSLQLAAAFSERCTVFLTNDRKLPALPGLRVIQLDEFL